MLDRFVWDWCDCGDFGYGWLLCCFGFFWSVTIIAGAQCRVLVVYWFWVYLVGLGFVLVLIIVCGFVLIVRLLGCGY